MASRAVQSRLCMLLKWCWITTTAVASPAVFAAASLPPQTEAASLPPHAKPSRCAILREAVPAVGFDLWCHWTLELHMEGNPRVENRGELGGGDPGKYLGLSGVEEGVWDRSGERKREGGQKVAGYWAELGIQTMWKPPGHMHGRSCEAIWESSPVDLRFRLPIFLSYVGVLSETELVVVWPAFVFAFSIFVPEPGTLCAPSISFAPLPSPII